MNGWSLPLLAVHCACDCEEECRQEGAAAAAEMRQRRRTALLVAAAARNRRLKAVPAVPHSLRSFSTAPDQPLLGVPVREGGLLHLSLQEHFEPVDFCLYINGMAFSRSEAEIEASICLSPFSLVRNCRFPSGESSRLKCFKVAFVDPDTCCYFAVNRSTSHVAEEERSRWVLALSHTILLVISSLLPSRELTCDPLPERPNTILRLLAGYLVHKDDRGSVSVPYCELQAPWKACMTPWGIRADDAVVPMQHLSQAAEAEDPSYLAARLVLYENQLCDTPLLEIIITEDSECYDVVGINCTCFVLDKHQFACQAPSERRLWLRTLSNVKVKLQNRAPLPSTKELLNFRESIREYMATSCDSLEPEVASEPLLSTSTKQSLQPLGTGDRALSHAKRTMAMRKNTDDNIVDVLCYGKRVCL